MKANLPREDWKEQREECRMQPLFVVGSFSYHVTLVKLTVDDKCFSEATTQARPNPELTIDRRRKLNQLHYETKDRRFSKRLDHSNKDQIGPGGHFWAGGSRRGVLENSVCCHANEPMT